MGNIRHTRGPWTIERITGRGPRAVVTQVRILGGPLGAVVAAPFGNGEDNRDANAALIAAAPGLLSSCEETTRCLQAILDRSGDPDDAYCEEDRLAGHAAAEELRRVIGVAREAIAAAKGGRHG